MFSSLSGFWARKAVSEPGLCGQVAEARTYLFDLNDWKNDCRSRKRRLFRRGRLDGSHWWIWFLSVFIFRLRVRVVYPRGDVEEWLLVGDPCHAMRSYSRFAARKSFESKVMRQNIPICIDWENMGCPSSRYGWNPATIIRKREFENLSSRLAAMQRVKMVNGGICRWLGMHVNREDVKLATGNVCSDQNISVRTETCCCDGFWMSHPMRNDAIVWFLSCGPTKWSKLQCTALASATCL